MGEIAQRVSVFCCAVLALACYCTDALGDSPLGRLGNGLRPEPGSDYSSRQSPYALKASPSLYTLRTTDGRQATIYVPPDDGPRQTTTQHARDSFACDSQLTELRIASEAEIAALTAQLEAAH